MHLLKRHSVLTLAALLTLLLALDQFRSRSSDSVPPQSVFLIAPPPHAAAFFKVQTKGSLVAVAKMIMPSRPAKVRGASLRDKGEAFGGGIPDQVDRSTGTLAAQ